jgi:hypothetical protein
MIAEAFPDHLLTLEEFTRLPEDNSRRYELQEGVLRIDLTELPDGPARQHGEGQK